MTSWPRLLKTSTLYYCSIDPYICNRQGIDILRTSFTHHPSNLWTKYLCLYIIVVSIRLALYSCRNSSGGQQQRKTRALRDRDTSALSHQIIQSTILRTTIAETAAHPLSLELGRSSNFNFGSSLCPSIASNYSLGRQGSLAVAEVTAAKQSYMRESCASTAAP